MSQDTGASIQPFGEVELAEYDALARGQVSPDVSLAIWRLIAEVRRLRELASHAAISTIRAADRPELGTNTYIDATGREGGKASTEVKQ